MAKCIYNLGSLVQRDHTDWTFKLNCPKYLMLYIYCENIAIHGVFVDFIVH
jgi:hypothetical protein